MRAAARLLTVLILAAAGFAVAQEKHSIDPTPPGSLNLEPLPPLRNPDAQSTPAKELFARKSTPFPGPPRSIGGYFDGCLAGAVALPITGPSWQAMRCHVTATGAIPNSFASSNGLPRTRRRLAGTVFWSATCHSRAAGQCWATTRAIK